MDTNLWKQKYWFWILKVESGNGLLLRQVASTIEIKGMFGLAMSREKTIVSYLLWKNYALYFLN